MSTMSAEFMKKLEAFMTQQIQSTKELKESTKELTEAMAALLAKQTTLVESLTSQSCNKSQKLEESMNEEIEVETKPNRFEEPEEMKRCRGRGRGLAIGILGDKLKVTPVTIFGRGKNTNSGSQGGVGRGKTITWWGKSPDASTRDIVLADGPLLEGDPLKIDQYALNGESLPVNKNPQVLGSPLSLLGFKESKNNISPSLLHAMATDVSDALAVRRKDQPFLIAAVNGNLDILKSVAAQLDDGKGILYTVESIKDANKRGALCFVAREGKIEVYKYLREELKPDVNAKDEDEATTLNHVAGTGYIKLMGVLLSTGVEVDLQSVVGTPLVWDPGGEENATWEDLVTFAEVYPKFELEDKLNPEEGSNDMVDNNKYGMCIRGVIKRSRQSEGSDRNFVFMHAIN